MRRALGLSTIGLTLALVVALAAGARPAADDVIIDVHLRFGTGNTAGPNFQIEVEIETTTGAEQAIVVRTTLPAGLRWGSDAPDPAEDCITANPAVCTTKTRRNEVGTVGAGWFWDVVADAPGVYDITATVEPTESDPDLSNNAETFRVEVSGTSGGGAGGSGGGRGTTAVTAAAVKLSPAKPRAGSTLVASVRVSRGGSPLRPTGVACSGSIGTAKVRGAPKAASGVASCLFKTPRSGKGKALTGTVSFRAGGASFTRRFAARLG